MITRRFHLLRNFLLAAAGLLAAIGLLGPRPTSAQTRAGLPQFEAASIKPSNSSAIRPGRLGSVQVVTTPGRLTARSAYLKELIKGAYGIEDYQVAGGPAWIGSAVFDVEAKSLDNANRDRLLLMLRDLLAERFKLAVHRETKQLAIYAITVAKNGPKFRALRDDEAKCWPACADSAARINWMRQKDLPSLAAFLTRLGSDRPVLDKTGLAGNFALEVDMSQILEVNENQRFPGNEIMFEGLTNAMEEKLGLKLVQTKTAVEMLVIDRAEKPSAN